MIYAQYGHDVDDANHAVTIVGWDDTLPASIFETEGKQPPADGGWIVRNSWGTDWGMDGYFYLSYYDETICAVQTYEFITDIRRAFRLKAVSLSIEGLSDQSRTPPTLRRDRKTIGIALVRPKIYY